MKVRDEIISRLKSAIADLAFQGVAWEAKELVLQTPKDESHGDYSSNIALTLFKDKGLRIKDKKDLTPLKLAQAIAEKLNNSSLIINHCSRIEAATPGFINFWLSKDYLSNNLQEVSEKRERFGNSEILKGKKVMVEFTDPNPFKEFHIGHLYSNTVGESISRLLEASGANVKRANYQGDVGMHIAKSLYAILQISNLKCQISNLEKESVKERAEFLGKCYAVGAKVYEEDENAKKEIEELNKKIYDKDPAIATLYEKGRQWSLEYFEEIYKRLGTQFDFYYFESEVGKIGVSIVKENLKKGVFEESDGAIIFPGEKYGLHTRVFVNSLGLPTYEAKDLGLAPTKYKDFSYDLSIIITAQEQSDYFKIVIKALGLIDPKLGAKTIHIAHGVVRLPSGKMSSRSGNVITGEWLLDEAKKLLKGKYSEMEEETLEKVAVGSVKYVFLKSSLGPDIEFDFEESINIQGNSGPYLQYTFARIQSVLAKVKSQKSKVRISFARPGLAKLKPEEVSVLRALNRFPEVVSEAGEKFAPNLLCNYLFDLAQKFNLFYQKHKIIGSENQEFRLALTNVTGIIIKKGLSLLGIQAPTKM